MAEIDLSKAYYSLPIDRDHRKYLRFRDLFQFCVLPNGLSLAPKDFTRIHKVLQTCLGKKGHISIAYIDDTLLIDKSMEESMKNIIDTGYIFKSAGFHIS